MLILCGKTATGKTTVAKTLQKLGMERVVTYTTRPAREGEINGIDYHFVTQEKFIELQNKDFFAETTCYSIKDGTMWYYGTPIKEFFAEPNRVLISNPSGINQILELCLEEEILAKIFICQLRCSDATIRMRLRKRGDDCEEIKRRVEADGRDFDGIEKFIHCSIHSCSGFMPVERLAKMILNLYKSYIEEDENY